MDKIFVTIVFLSFYNLLLTTKTALSMHREVLFIFRCVLMYSSRRGLWRRGYYPHSGLVFVSFQRCVCCGVRCFVGNVTGDISEPREVRVDMRTYRVGQKQGHRLMTIILSNLNRFKYVCTGRFPGKFAVKCLLKIPPHLAYVATIHCKTLMSAKRALNDKLQGRVAVYLKCGETVNNQIKKGLLLSLWVKKTF